MKQMLLRKTVQALTVVSVAGLMVACSGSSGDGESATLVNGYVVAAPVSGASVEVKDATGINTLVDAVTTATDGKYSIDPGAASSGAYTLVSSGGTYTDEATGASTTAGIMAAYVDGANLAAGSQVQLTPASTIVHGMVVTHGMEPSAALTAFKDTFGFAADSAAVPADANNPAADATSEELLSGLRVAVFSQLTADLGLAPAEQFDLLAALAEDLADGSLDGEGTSGDIAMLPIDILSRFSQSLVAFFTSTYKDTALTSDMIGVVPFASVAMTASYKVEYVSGEMGEMEGKTMFTLHISDAAGEPVSENVTLMTMMYMADHKHSSPDIDCMASAITAGEYHCTVYYLMASVMSTGMSMGYWELKVMVGMGGESTTFYPMVMMAMGDTPKVKLQAQTAGTDKIMNMDGEAMARKYFVFNDGGLTETSFNMFVAAVESMMSYPAVSVGTVLSEGKPVQLIVNTMTVEVSTAAAPTSTDWVDAVDAGSDSGSWSATGLSGLSNGTEAKIHVRLTINDEVKTTDGNAPGMDINGDPIALDDSGNPLYVNEYSTFTVTPGGM